MESPQSNVPATTAPESVPPAPPTASSVLPSSPSPEPPRIAVVVNGRAKNVTAEVISTLGQILSGGDLFVSRSLSDAKEIAKTLVQRRYGTVLTGGGDGTFTVMVTEVVHEARRTGRPLPRFGLLKLGTGNSLAWVVGAGEVKGGELDADIEHLAQHAGSRTLRLIEVEGIISPFCGLGADARVLADYGAVKERLSRGRLGRRLAPGAVSYTVAAVTRSLPQQVLGRMPHCRIVNAGEPVLRMGAKGSVVGRPIERGEVVYEGPARLAAMSTIPYYGYGFRMFPYAEERPDRMHLRVATISPLQFVRHFAEIWRGSFEDPGSVFDYLVEAIDIELDPPTPFQIGGDSRGDRSKLHVALCKNPVELVDLYAPPSVPA
ncbi:MAG TPA: diacylglycerol kinase family protein [Polyangiaceae bacterium]|nr:diacylglycerol kinase family protein [Polyangiaceae bacterium]